MGIQITNTNANYSGLGLGFASFIDEYFSKVGMTNEAHKTAFRNLYSSLVSAGLWSNGMQIYPYYGSTAATHKVVFAETVYDLTEIGGTLVHDAGGVTGATNGYYVTNFTPPTDMSLGLNGGTNALTAPNNTGKFWGISGENTGGVADYCFAFGGTTFGAQFCLFFRYGQLANPQQTYTGHIMTTGFYQFSGIGAAQNVLLGAATIRTVSLPTTPIGGGARKLHLMTGMVDSSGAPGSTNYTNIKTNFQYISPKGYTVAQMLSFNTIVATFLTGIGR